MKRYIFKIRCLTDLVLLASSNTEGKRKVLDFIPGSVFMGIAAKAYKDYENVFDVIHSGAVRFGDAHLLVDGQWSFKTPLCYAFIKDTSQSQNALLNPETAETPLQQVRSNYINVDGAYKTPSYDYLQKTAYDNDKRRPDTKEGSMFGYDAIDKNTEFAFELKINGEVSENDTALLLKTLLGEHHVGKSKTSQYGKISIEQDSVTLSKEVHSNVINDKATVIYAYSRVVLCDENGNSTLDPVTGLLPGKKVDIDWSSTFIRSGQYTPYNGVRKCFDSTRMFLDKGTVVVANGLSENDKTALKKGVGAFLSEGFGELLIDPEFVTTELKLEKFKEPIKDIEATASNLADALVLKKQTRDDKLTLINDVESFVEKYSHWAGTMKSQWGVLFALSKIHKDEALIEAIKKQSDKETLKEKWKGKTEVLCTTLTNQKNKGAFIAQLAMKLRTQQESR